MVSLPLPVPLLALHSTSPYLEMLEEGGDAGDLEAEAPGGASGSVDPVQGEGFVLPASSISSNQAAPGKAHPEEKRPGPGPVRGRHVELPPVAHGVASAARALVICPGMGRDGRHLPTKAGEGKKQLRHFQQKKFPHPTLGAPSSLQARSPPPWLDGWGGGDSSSSSRRDWLLPET